MTDIHLVLPKKLKEADPTLDTYGFDRKILKIACQDFTNYFKFVNELDHENPDESDVHKRISAFLEENSEEAQSYLTLWTNIWLRKWKQRIKLFIGQQQPNKTNTPPQATAETESRWDKLENRQEMLQMIIFTLIRIIA